MSHLGPIETLVLNVQFSSADPLANSGRLASSGERRSWPPPPVCPTRSSVCEPHARKVTIRTTARRRTDHRRSSTRITTSHHHLGLALTGPNCDPPAPGPSSPTLLAQPDRSAAARDKLLSACQTPHARRRAVVACTTPVSVADHTLEHCRQELIRSVINEATRQHAHRPHVSHMNCRGRLTNGGFQRK